jgi:hypothetical protein
VLLLLPLLQPPPPPPPPPYSDCFLTESPVQRLIFHMLRKQKFHKFRSGELGHNPLLIIMSPKTLCKQCAEFNYKTYHQSTYGVRMCVSYQWEFMVSSNNGPDNSHGRTNFSLVNDTFLIA